MSSAFLIEDLRCKGREKVEDLWAEARGELELRKVAEMKHIEEARQRCRHDAKILERKEGRRLLLAAEKKAQAIRSAAFLRFTERLYTRAVDILPEFRGRAEAGTELFASLARELPQRRWGLIEVHPDDLEQAKKLFPEVEIRSDDAQSGGLIATTEDKSLTVVNTLLKRLERSWPELVSKMAHMGRVDGHLS